LRVDTVRRPSSLAGLADEARQAGPRLSFQTRHARHGTNRERGRERAQTQSGARGAIERAIHREAQSGERHRERAQVTTHREREGGDLGVTDEWVRSDWSGKD